MLRFIVDMEVCYGFHGARHRIMKHFRWLRRKKSAVHNLHGADNARRNTTQSESNIGPHQPLSSSRHGIRLLTLVYVDVSKVICELTNYDDLDLCPPFIALSYTWGSPLSPTHMMTLNGHAFQIRENLYAFFQHYTHAKEAWTSHARSDVNKHDMIHNPSPWKHFWIDALCIDQLSLEEKSHQVDLMSQIFGRASFVLVWLPTLQSYDSSSTAPATTSGNPPNKDVSKRQLLMTILDNPYWGRLWVVQEFILARDLLFCVDTTMLTLKDFRQRREPAWTGRYEDKFETLMAERYQKEYDRTPQYLPDLVARFSEYECEDLRDRVFGLLGLIGAGPRTEADYNLPALKLYALMLGTYTSYFLRPPPDRRLVDSHGEDKGLEEYGQARQRLAEALGLEPKYPPT